MQERDTDPPFFAPQDIGLALTETAHAVIARGLSATAGDRLAPRLARLALTLRGAKKDRLAALYTRFTAGRAPPIPAGDYPGAIIASLLQERMFYARLAADRRWRPDLAVTGFDTVEAALEGGQGAVLWVYPLELAPLLLRLACTDRGRPVSMMSHRGHGPARGRIGDMIINRRTRRIESNFGGRLVLTNADRTTALSQARTRIRAGGLVGFRGIGWAGKPAEYPLFGGHMRLALGAPVTARRAGAPLFTVRLERRGAGFHLEFAPLDAGPPRTLDEIGAAFAAGVERAIRAAPSLWKVDAWQWSPDPLPGRA